MPTPLNHYPRIILKPLSNSEIEVLQLTTLGLNNKDISDKHFTSYKVIIKNVVNNLHFACDYTRANGEPIELIEFDSYDNIEFMQIEGLNGN